MKVLIIIPAFNEEANISLVVKNLQKTNPDADYVIINDCSSDHTKDILIQNNYNHINLPVNLGIGGGVQTGYLYAMENGYDIAVQLDGDGQHNPAYIQALLQPIVKGEADFVIGSRFLMEEGFKSSQIRQLGIRFLSALIYVCCHTRIKDVTSGFRAVNKKGIELFASDYAQDYPEPEAIITAAAHNLRITEVPVIMNERKGGTSSISMFKSVYYMIKVSIAIVLLSVTQKRRHKSK